MSRIEEVSLWRADLPLVTPYRLSYRTFESFEPLLVRIRSSDGREAWGEQHISPGSSKETREGGWAFATAQADAMLGREADDALATVEAAWAESPVAATALATALEMLIGEPMLAGLVPAQGPARVELLTSFNATEGDAIAAEVERRLGEGFRTLKIKVGKDWRADLVRVAAIQAAGAGRATLRLDANRAFSREDAISFAKGLDPANIMLFEQPCHADDWDANAAVAAVSPVPVMLDEPICALADIDRAATIPGVGLCKVKLKRFGGMRLLAEAIDRVHGHGMEAVCGDGIAAEINCWMEAAVCAGRLRNAGEFNGYVKIRPEARLLADPLGFEDGHMVVPAGWQPRLDEARLAAHMVAEHHARARRAA